MENATYSFSDDNLIGKGGFGRVYTGTLKSGQVIVLNCGRGYTTIFVLQ
jgi:predicted Ser/Thr protein kinase